jgi:hypothetical protein
MKPHKLSSIGVGLLSLAACGSAPKASPEQQAAAEQRLLQPFLVDREVGCGELLVELTGNFHDNVGQPALDSVRHRMTKEEGDGYRDTIWTNLSGAPEAAFMIRIGEPSQINELGIVQGRGTRFRVVNQVRLRVYEGRRALTLNATAGGPVVLVREASDKPRDVRQFTIVDGILKG